jgi:hypothetical protein
MAYIAHLSNIARYENIFRILGIHFHSLLLHLTLGGHDFYKLAYGLCQKVFMYISADFNKKTVMQTTHTRD